MSIDDFINPTTNVDYNDYDEDTASEIDARVVNDCWLENTQQRYYVVKTAERALTPTSPRDIDGRRTDAQETLADEVGISKQAVQSACHRDLFQGFETPPTNPQGQKLWYVLFDQVLHDIERARRGDLPR
jgi:hypothetical protein